MRSIFAGPLVLSESVTATTSVQQQLSQVQADIAATEQQMQTAPDQSTVQKLQAKSAARAISAGGRRISRNTVSRPALSL